MGRRTIGTRRKTHRWTIGSTCEFFSLFQLLRLQLSYFILLLGSSSLASSNFMIPTNKLAFILCKPVDYKFCRSRRWNCTEESGVEEWCLYFILLSRSTRTSTNFMVPTTYSLEFTPSSLVKNCKVRGSRRWNCTNEGCGKTQRVKTKSIRKLTPWGALGKKARVRL